LDTIAATQQLLPEEDEFDDETCDDEAEFELDLDLNTNLPDSGYSTWDFTQNEDIQALLDSFTKEADDTIHQAQAYSDPLSMHSTSQIPQRPKTSAPHGPKRPHPMSSVSTPNNTNPFPLPDNLRQHNTSSEFPMPTTASSHPTSTPSTPSSQTHKYRCHCGYEPIGSEEWKASNFARHKRTQHAPAAKAYKCQFPGCTAKYKRSDNLRAHLRLKGHGDEELMLGDGGGVLEDDEEEAEMSVRPSKRRRRGEASRQDGGDLDKGQKG
jgi:hypothetical protein